MGVSMEEKSVKTRSEEVFESFLDHNSLAFKKIEEVTSPQLDSVRVSNRRPDYLVHVGDCQLIFEVKQLEGSFRGVPGIHVRGAIRGSRRQIQYGAKQGAPSILLIYNMIDPLFQLSGTDDLDFETAMYGEKTILIDINTRESSGLFNGRDDSLQENLNRSFSAVGRLADRVGEPTVKLFENSYAKVQVPYDQLPPCFEVVRIRVSKVEPFSAHE
jgi:hypothetical protein